MNFGKYYPNPADCFYHYAKIGLLHKNRTCPFCQMPMRIIKSNGSARLFGFSLAWQCVRCKARKSVTSYTPLQFVDLKVFDAAIHLFLDNFSTTVGNKLCRTSVS